MVAVVIRVILRGIHHRRFNTGAFHLQPAGGAAVDAAQLGKGGVIRVHRRKFLRLAAVLPRDEVEKIGKRRTAYHRQGQEDDQQHQPYAAFLFGRRVFLLRQIGDQQILPGVRLALRCGLRFRFRFFGSLRRRNIRSCGRRRLLRRFCRLCFRLRLCRWRLYILRLCFRCGRFCELRSVNLLIPLVQIGQQQGPQHQIPPLLFAAEQQDALITAFNHGAANRAIFRNQRYCIGRNQQLLIRLHVHILRSRHHLPPDGLGDHADHRTVLKTADNNNKLIPNRGLFERRDQPGGILHMAA